MERRAGRVRERRGDGVEPGKRESRGERGGGVRVGERGGGCVGEKDCLADGGAVGSRRGDADAHHASVQIVERRERDERDAAGVASRASASIAMRAVRAM